MTSFNLIIESLELRVMITFEGYIIDKKEYNI